MKCPSCAAHLSAPVSRCPECKFSLQRLDMKFGLVPRHSRYLSDRSGRLPIPDMEAIRKELRLFEKKFPQILLSVLVTELPAGSGVNEYAFWMANRARFSSVKKKENDNFDMLLVLDVVAQEAALTTGYGLEPYVNEEVLRSVLEAMAGPLRKGDLPGGIHAGIRALTTKLRECSDLAISQPLESADL